MQSTLKFECLEWNSPLTAEPYKITDFKLAGAAAFSFCTNSSSFGFVKQDSLTRASHQLSLAPPPPNDPPPKPPTPPPPPPPPNPPPPHEPPPYPGPPIHQPPPRRRGPTTPPKRSLRRRPAIGKNRKI